MNCKELEIIISDVARKRLMDADMHEAARTHTQHCRACAVRLAEEQQLTVGLRALAILDEHKQASAQVEANLLSAFRKHHESSQPADGFTPVGAPVFSASFAPAKPSRFTRWAIAAAAVIFILLALVAWRLQNNGSSAATINHQAIQQPNPDNPNIGEQGKEEEDKSVSRDKPMTPDNSGSSVVGARPNKLQPPQRTPSTKDVSRLNHRIAATPVKPSPSTPVEPTAQEEIATPFLSLTQGYTLPMAEGGQVVRVELPRSALASFGLPVNRERLNEPVKADVVVGNDGIARAIRFIR